MLESIEPSGAVALARCELAAAFLDDLRRIDAQMLGTKKKLAVTVRASGTTLTGIFGVGPVIAATMIGYVADVSRFPSRDRFAAYNGTAPVEVSSGNRKIYRLSRRGNRRLNHAVHMAAVTQIRYRHSDGRAYYDRKLAEGKTPKKPSAASSGGSATPSTPACRPTPAGPPHSPGQRAREGNRGTTLSPARPAHTPKTSSSAKPLPSPPPPYDPRADAHAPVPHQPRRKTGKALDTKRLRYARLPLPDRANPRTRRVGQSAHRCGEWGAWALVTQACCEVGVVAGRMRLAWTNPASPASCQGLARLAPRARKAGDRCTGRGTARAAERLSALVFQHRVSGGRAGESGHLRPRRGRWRARPAPRPPPLPCR